MNPTRTCVSGGAAHPAWQSLAVLILPVLFIFLSAPAADATISYDISLAHQQDHIFQVRMHIPNAANGTKIAIPAWNALYQIRDFASRVRDVTAVAMSDNGGSGGNLPILKLDKQTWQIGKPIAIVESYKVE